MRENDTELDKKNKFWDAVLLRIWQKIREVHIKINMIVIRCYEFTYINHIISARPIEHTTKSTHWL